jgi:hypothetical protein
VYAILGSVDALPWSALAWARISKALTPFLARSRGRAAIRTTQFGGVAGLDEAHLLRAPRFR